MKSRESVPSASEGWQRNRVLTEEDWKDYGKMVLFFGIGGKDCDIAYEKDGSGKEVRVLYLRDRENFKDAESIKDLIRGA
jgi:hypothetical protein